MVCILGRSVLHVIYWFPYMYYYDHGIFIFMVHGIRILNLCDQVQMPAGHTLGTTTKSALNEGLFSKIGNTAIFYVGIRRKHIYKVLQTGVSCRVDLRLQILRNFPRFVRPSEKKITYVCTILPRTIISYLLECFPGFVRLPTTNTPSQTA